MLVNKKVQGSETEKATQTPTDQRNRIIGIAAVAAAALVVILIIVNLAGGSHRDYKTTVDQFVTSSLSDPDGKTLISLVPEKVLAAAGYDKKDRKELAATLEDQLSSQNKQLAKALGKNWKLTYSIYEDLEKEDGDLEAVQERYEDYDVKVTAARTVRVELKFKASSGTQKTSLRIPLIKVGGAWYIDFVEMGRLGVSLHF